jgi:outer membrane protein OmpU
MNNKNKGVNMNNLKKLGATALAGSLVAVSAQAGELSVTGHATATLKTKGGSGSTAQTLGHNTAVSFAGSGELDNGYTWNTFVVMADGLATMSSSALTMTMGSMGTIGISRVGGFNINGAYDETYPRAYEENSDAGGQSPSNYVGSIADDNAIIYASPSYDIMGASVNFGIEYALDADTATGKDGAVAADGPTYDEAIGVGVTASMAGLTLGVYGSEATRNNPGGGSTITGEFSDNFSGTYFVNYSMGPVSIGYQKAYVDIGAKNGTDTADATTAAKTVGTSTGNFEDESMSIAFNVNDDLSISYAETESTYKPSTYVAGTSNKNADVIQDSDSIQIAYSMGAMSVKAYSTEIKNINYVDGATETSVNELAIGLAF